MNFTTAATNKPRAAEWELGGGAVAAPQSRVLGTKRVGKVSYRGIWTQDLIPSRLSFQGFLLLVWHDLVQP